MKTRMIDRLDFLRRPVEKMGCNWDKVKAVVDLQLTLDARRKTSRKKNDGKEGGIFRTMLLMYGITGLFTALIVFMVPDPYVRLSLGFFFIFLMAGLIMITDFSAIILDRQGQFILQTKPLGQRDLHLAKLLHIFVYMGFMTIVLGFPLLAMEAVRDGVRGVLVCLLAYMGMDMITVVFTAFLYAVLLRLFSGEQLRDVIQILQVGVTIFMVLIYQVFNQGIQLAATTARLTPAWWHLVLPSQWYAAWMTTTHSPIVYLLRAAGLILPVILLLAYLKFLAPRFDGMLYRLDENKERTDLKKLRRGLARQRRAARLFTRSAEEAAGFLFGTRLVKGERKVQMIVIPQLALGLVFPLIFLIPARLRGASLEELQAIPFYYALYMSGFMVLPMGLYTMKSEYFQAAWLFDALPIKDPARMRRGLMKSFFVRYQLPVLLIPTGILIGFYGVAHTAEILTIFFLLCTFARLNHRGLGTGYPFSEDVAAVQESRSRTMKMVFLNMALLILIGAVQGLLTYVVNVIWLLLPLSAALSVFAWETDLLLKKSQRS